MPKSPGLLPPRATLRPVAEEVVPFFNVSVCALLVVPTVWLPKVRLVGESVTVATLLVKLQVSAGVD
jgi:hypothetical protein